MIRVFEAAQQQTDHCLPITVFPYPEHARLCRNGIFIAIAIVIAIAMERLALFRLIYGWTIT